jgi:hypothetical protein
MYTEALLQPVVTHALSAQRENPSMPVAAFEQSLLCLWQFVVSRKQALQL